MITRNQEKKLNLKLDMFECFRIMWDDFRISKNYDTEKPKNPLYFFFPNEPKQFGCRLAQPLFIFELISRFTHNEDEAISTSKYFYPIHYFSKSFFENYQRFLQNKSHVLVDFPGIVDISATVIDYNRLDNSGKKVYFLLQHWHYFSHRAGGITIANYIDIKSSLFQWSLFLYVLNIFISFGYAGLEQFRTGTNKLTMIHLDRFEDSEEVFTDKVFNEINTSELYMQIELLKEFDRLLIKFKTYGKFVFSLFRTY